MKLLVTGGAGYVGSIVSRVLLDAGHQLTVLDNLERGYRDAVPSEVTLVEADLRDAEAVSRCIAGAGFEGVLHFAALALVAESVADPGMYYANNVGGTLNLLNAMAAHDVPRLVFSSTCATYGQPETVPITETEPPKPVNAYGKSKLAADHAIADFCVAYRIGAVSLRYFNVAGAHGHVGERHVPETHLIPNVMDVALGKRESVDVFGTDYRTADGTAVRDYIHVDDLALAHTLALDAVRPGVHKIYNLGTGTGFSVRQVIAAVERVTGSSIPTIERPRRPGDPPELVAAAGLARDELGWVPQKPDLDTIVADAWRFAQIQSAKG
jgi:UDP-glucose 4-epimerase